MAYESTVNFTEFLAEREEITPSRSSVRHILPKSGLKSPRKRRPPKHHSRGERYPKEGMLLQADDSRHGWLQGGGPYLTLGHRQGSSCFIPGARGCPGIFSLITRQIVSSHGIPMALYHDRHSIFERPKGSQSHWKSSLRDGERSYARARVEAHERLDEEELQGISRLTMLSTIVASL